MLPTLSPETSLKKLIALSPIFSKTYFKSN